MHLDTQRIASALRLDLFLAVLWCFELFHVALPVAALETPLAAALLAYLALSLVGLRWQTLLLCTVLGGGALAICAAYDAWAAYVAGAKRALIFAAFLPTILMIRATADRRPEISRAREMLSLLPAAHRRAGLMFGLHLLAAILSIGIFALLVSVMDPRTPAAERQRLVGIGLRSICLCALWSPFFVGMGVVTYFIPSVPLWQVMALGLSFATAGLVLSFVLFDRSGGVRGLLQTLGTLTPLVPPIALAALILVAATRFTPLSTLEALVITMPVLCAAAMLSMGGDHLRDAIGATRLGLANIRGEVGILALAVILGTAIEAALPATGLSGSLSGLRPTPVAVIAFIIGAMSLTGLMGFHPMVSLTVLLAVSASMTLPLHDLVLAQTLLIGWGFGAMISISGISVVTAAALFDVPPERLVRGENILFVALMGTGAVAALAGLNRLLQ